MKRLSGRHPRHAARTAFRATVALVTLSLTVGMARADFVVLAASGASGALQPFVHPFSKGGSGQSGAR